MLIFKNNKEKILIFGAGSGAINFYRLNKKQYNIVGFLDNNSQKQGQLLFNKKIYSPDELSNIDYDRIIIASDYYREIYEQLVEQLGLNEKKIDIFYAIDSVEVSIWKKFINVITDYKYKWLCDSDTWLFNILYSFYTRKNELQLRDIVWLDEMEEYKVKILRKSQAGNVYGPNFLEKEAMVKPVTIPEVALYRLCQGQIGSTNRSVIMKDGRVVIERVVTASQDNTDYSGGHLVMHGQKRALVRVFQTKYIVKGIALIGVSETNYYHWIIEVLSQLQYLDELSEEYIDYPLLISNCSQNIHSIQEFLNYFNIKRQIIFLHTTQSYLVDELMIISSPNNLVPNSKYKAWSPVENCFVSNESLDYLRQLAIGSVKNSTENNSPKRIFFARKDYLRSYNQNEISKLLYQYNFVELYFEDLSFSEQVNIMQGAEIIVGPTGAAWTNLIFGKTGAKALCWMAEEYGDLSCFSNLAEFVGIQMDYLTYKANTNNSREIYYRSYSIDVDAVRLWLISNLG